LVLPPAEIGTAQQEIPVSNFTASEYGIFASTFTAAEQAILRRSAANWKGSRLPKTIGGKLRLAKTTLIVLRNSEGQVAGWGREGFVLTPGGMGLYGWAEERARQAHINNN
jgi:hypothetical protein